MKTLTFRHLIFIPILLAFAINSTAQDTVKQQHNIPDGMISAPYVPPVVKQKQNQDAIYETVDENPEPPGGMSGYMKYIRENFKYPKGVDEVVEGKIYLSVIIEKDGTISDVKVKKDPLGKPFSDEAVRVIKQMPKWKPGKLNGSPVRCRYTIPIRIELH